MSICFEHFSADDFRAGRLRDLPPVARSESQRGKGIASLLFAGSTITRRDVRQRSRRFNHRPSGPPPPSVLVKNIASKRPNEGGCRCCLDYSIPVVVYWYRSVIRIYNRPSRDNRITLILMRRYTFILRAQTDTSHPRTPGIKVFTDTVCLLRVHDGACIEGTSGAFYFHSLSSRLPQ